MGGGARAPPRRRAARRREGRRDQADRHVPVLDAGEGERHAPLELGRPTPGADLRAGRRQLENSTAASGNARTPIAFGGLELSINSASQANVF